MISYIETYPVVHEFSYVIYYNNTFLITTGK